MSSSIDFPRNRAADYANEAPLAFRRERNWFLSFVMMPFQDMDKRTIEDQARRQPRDRRGR